jgi:hypothetical protein
MTFNLKALPGRESYQFLTQNADTNKTVGYASTAGPGRDEFLAEVR